MTTHNPTVSVVIPTYNNDRLLEKCLASIQRQSYPADSIEVVVVDNAASTGTARLLSTRFPQAKRIAMPQNSGFAAACNRGAAQASNEYVAFLNDDTIAEPDWLTGLFSAIETGKQANPHSALRTPHSAIVCAASHIRSYDNSESEFSGASANLYGVGRPVPPANVETLNEGDPILFASGGAMLIHRRTFLDVGGFDPNYFAYFEDVDLGWRLWVLGYAVVYAPNSVVRHLGGATGSRSGAHRRYTLWECNALATVLKNYESGNMERILSAALMLLYKRALLSAGDAFNPEDYKLTGPPDSNPANVERLPKISVAHLAAIDRFNALLPRFMEERNRIQTRRVRSDAEILPLLGRLHEPQFAGSEYAEAASALAAAMQLDSKTDLFINQTKITS